MDDGRAVRIYTWKHAQAARRESLTVEQVRRRRTRAAELGMSYATYASVRATAGRDVDALVFTSNALGLQGGGPLDRSWAERLAGIRRCLRIGLLSAPLDPVEMAEVLPLDRVYRAPPAHASWPALRAALARVQEGRPASSFVLVGRAPWEEGWVAAGRLGAYLAAGTYLGGALDRA
ncbi:hypothetical protein [Oceanicola sp. 22II-s10i]|uniref:hypothetical protein n=1 Tax=Oceanicola sp. 22II-s10i TaxID=1317116 RepID=UPI000B525282|nr:hypothetical protein [Oceanicola sp. 22II-s10i]